MSASQPSSGLFEIESRTIEPVPEDERHGKARELFGVWAGMNAFPVSLVTGAIATAGLGLPVLWAIVALVLGHAIGAIFVALHAAQGPRLGVPQMVQARGQFGSRGALLVVAIASIMFIGFFSSNLVVGAQALQAEIDGMPLDLAIVAFTLISFGITLCGYRLIRLGASLAALLTGAVSVVVLIYLAVSGELPAGTMSKGDLTTVGFMTTLAIAVVWEIAYGPYVSDYSRYMPADTGAKGAFWGTYLGTFTGSVLFMSVGALVGAAATDGDPIGGLHALAGSLAAVALVLFALASATSNSINAYTSSLSSLTAVETFKPGWVPSLRARILATAFVHLWGLAVGLAARGDFLTHYTNFVTVLLYVMIPWSAINLVDYYLVRKGNYDVASFFQADGGVYGRYNATALWTYAIAVALQVPFMYLSFYTGPLVDDFGGIDWAWLVGLVASAGGYYVVAKRQLAREVQAIPVQPGGPVLAAETLEP
jgi:NCS1 family nucleobase:cation symporter-1